MFFQQNARVMEADVSRESALSVRQLQRLFPDATGLTRDEVLGKLGAIDKKALDALLKSLGKKLDKPRVSLLKAELEAHADKRMSPRLWAKEVA